VLGNEARVGDPLEIECHLKAPVTPFANER
jgi:hypothetical protein